MKKEEMYRILKLMQYSKRQFRCIVNAQQELERAGNWFDDGYNFVFDVIKNGVKTKWESK